MKISKEIQDSVINDYLHNKNIMGKDIVQKYNINIKTFYKILKKNNVKLLDKERLAYKLDKNYFDTVDTQDKAYWFGFIEANGTVIYKHTKKTRQYYLAIGLQNSDRYLIEQFKEDIKYDGPLRLVPRQKEQYQDICLIKIANKYLAEALIKLKCLPNKSLTLKFPTNIPNELMSHFIRGYFDGDGCVSLNKETRTKKISLICSPDFAKSLKDFFTKIGITSYLSKRDKMTDVVLNSIDDIKKFINYIYKDANRFMSRKFNICNDILNFSFFGAKGSKTWSSKLIESEIKEIKYLHIYGFLNREISKLYNVSESVICNIVNGKAWRHIK